jgi:uncharacterized protein YkwD
MATGADALSVRGFPQRLGLVVAIAALCLGAGVAEAAVESAQTMTAQNRLESRIVSELNTLRRSRGLVPLRLSPALSAAAEGHTRSMATYGFFAHESRDGRTVMQRVRPYYGRIGGWSVGENLLWASGSLTSAKALEMWMGSPGHRRNMLTATWQDVGVAAVFVPAAPGVYEDLDAVIVTMTFGTRS